MDKHLKVLGNIVFLLLLLFSINFYQHRILNYDTSYQLTKIINREFFNIEAARYSTVFTQIIPLIGIWLGLPLKWVLYLFSISFILVYYFVYYLITYRLKRPFIGILVPIVLIFGVKDNFFYTVTETHQALVYSVLFFAWISQEHYKNRITEISVAFLLILLSFFAHPVSFFTLTYCILFQMVYSKNYKNFVYYYYFFFLIFLAVSKTIIGKLFPEINPYETGLFNNLDYPTVFNVLKNFFSNYTFLFFKNRIFSLFLVFLLAYTILFLEMLVIKKLKEFLLVSFFSISFIVFTIIIYHLGDADCQMEKDYMPLSLFLCTPLLVNLDKNTHSLLNKVKFAYLIFGFTFHFSQIVSISKFYSIKIEYLKQLVEYGQKKNHQKWVVNKSNVPKAEFVFWPLATETLLLSASEAPEKTVTFFFCDQANPFNYIHDTSWFHNASFWEPWKLQDLNTKYFNFPKNNYQVFNIKDFDTKKFKNSLSCGAENLDTSNQSFIENGFSFYGVNYRTDEKKHSGNYSIKLFPNDLNGFFTKIPIKNVTFLKVGVWFYCNEPSSAKLVVHSSNPEHFYIEKNEPLFQDSISLWRYMQLDFLINHKNSNDSLIIYTKNNSNEIVYYDNITIKF